MALTGHKETAIVMDGTKYFDERGIMDAPPHSNKGQYEKAYEEAFAGSKVKAQTTIDGLRKLINGGTSDW